MECRAHRLVADVALLAAGEVLLVRYRDVRRYDGQRGWFLPDDHLAFEEHPDDGARRILREQTGLEAAQPRLAFIESLPGDGGPWHLIFHYRAEIAAPIEVSPAGNVAATAWFQLDRPPAPAEVAHDGWALDVLERIRTEA